MDTPLLFDLLKSGTLSNEQAEIVIGLLTKYATHDYRTQVLLASNTYYFPIH